MSRKTFWRIFALCASTVFLLWTAMYPDRLSAIFGRIGAILSPFIIGGAVAFLVNVPMSAIEKRLFKNNRKFDKLRRPLALVLGLLVVLAIIAFVCIAVIPELVQTISLLGETIPPFLTDASEQITLWANALFDDTPALLKWINSLSFNWESIISKVDEILESSVGGVLGSTYQFALRLFGGIANALIGLIFAIYLLLAKDDLARQGKLLLYAWLKPEQAAWTLDVLGLSKKAFTNFITGQCTEACILGLMFMVSMSLLRFPHVMLISVLVGFTALIPIFGAFIGCAVGAFLILMQNPMQAVWFVVMFLILQQIEGNIIYPKVVGKAIGLPAIWVLAAVTVGGTAFGLAGMIVMIPICSVVYVLIRRSAYARVAEKGLDIAEITRVKED